MKRVVTFVLLLVCIAGSVFAVDDTSDKTLTVEVNRVAVSAIAFTKEEIADGTTSFGNKVYSGGDIVLDAQENLSNDKYEDDTVWASAISNDDKNPIKLYLKFTPLTKGEGSNVEYIPLTITSVTNPEKTDEAVDADGAVIDFSETTAGRGMRAISHQLKISMSKSDYENASTGEYSSTLTLTVSND